MATRSLSTIAADVHRCWGEKVSHYARPYFDAMEELDDIRGNYYADSAASVVRYFLANATKWRGDDARRIKAELKGMLASAGV